MSHVRFTQVWSERQWVKKQAKVNLSSYLEYLESLSVSGSLVLKVILKGQVNWEMQTIVIAYTQISSDILWCTWADPPQRPSVFLGWAAIFMLCGGMQFVRNLVMLLPWLAAVPAAVFHLWQHLPAERWLQRGLGLLCGVYKVWKRNIFS